MGRSRARGAETMTLGTQRWLAVDSEGFVGIFDAGEHGVIPERATRWTTAADARRDWPLTLARVARALAGHTDALAGPSTRRFALGTERALVVLAEAPKSAGYRSSARYAELEDVLDQARQVHVVREAAPRVIATRLPIASELADRLASEPRVARWLLEDDLLGVVDELDGSCVFRWTAQPEAPRRYRRLGHPSDSLRASDLEPPQRARVERVRLPMRFDAVDSLDLSSRD